MLVYIGRNFNAQDIESRMLMPANIRDSYIRKPVS